jgi:A/G-specific adenine glycosylase
MPEKQIPSGFAKNLLSWFMIHAREMPWRKLDGNADPYRVWVSEIMLQQTTVTTVLGYYEKWFKTFPTIKELADASEQEVLKQWQGLGYYSRARNMLKCAQHIMHSLGGNLPDSVDELRKLPGFGPYTAAAVGSIAFNCREPLVDANVRRVMMRILAIQDIISTKHDAVILSQLRNLIPAEQPGNFNQAMMELGALICVPSEPHCNQCPVRTCCRAYEQSIQELIPKPTIKVIKEITAVIAVIEVNNKILIQQRPKTGLLAGLWEFPGGKVEISDKNHENALKREIMEETGIDITINRKLGQVTHFYTQFKVKLIAFICTAKGDIKESNTLKLVRKEELGMYPMPSGSAKIIDKYKSIFK